MQMEAMGEGWVERLRGNRLHLLPGFKMLKPACTVELMKNCVTLEPYRRSARWNGTDLRGLEGLPKLGTARALWIMECLLSRTSHAPFLSLALSRPASRSSLCFLLFCTCLHNTQHREHQ